MRIQITPSTILAPGTAQRLLAEIGVEPVLVSKVNPGTLRCEMTEQQLNIFGLRGAAHFIEVLPDAARPGFIPVQKLAAPAAPVAAPVLPLTPQQRRQQEQRAALEAALHKKHPKPAA